MASVTKERRPRRTVGKTYAFRISSKTGGGDLKGYMTTGEYEDGRLCEVFLKVAKQGGSVSGMTDTVAIILSHALQHGVPVADLCKGLVNMRFEPTGDTDDPEIPQALSVSDYIGRRLALDYCTQEEREKHGLEAVHDRFGMETSWQT